MTLFPNKIKQVKEKFYFLHCNLQNHFSTTLLKSKNFLSSAMDLTFPANRGDNLEA